MSGSRPAVFGCVGALLGVAALLFATGSVLLWWAWPRQAGPQLALATSPARAAPAAPAKAPAPEPDTDPVVGKVITLEGAFKGDGVEAETAMGQMGFAKPPSRPTYAIFLRWKKVDVWCLFHDGDISTTFLRRGQPVTVTGRVAILLSDGSLVLDDCRFPGLSRR